MDSDLFKKSSGASALFLISAIVLFFAAMPGTTEVGTNEMFSYALFYFLFSSTTFYFLFKYQKIEYHNKSIFWKLILVVFVLESIFTIYHIFTHPGIIISILPIIIPFFFLILCSSLIIASILALNAWYRTNLYIVVLSISLFVAIPSIYLIALKQGLEEPAIVMPFGFVTGTLLAIYLKRTPIEIRESVNTGALWGGTIITPLVFIILFIAGEFKNFTLDSIDIETVFMILLITIVIIIISMAIGALVGLIYGKRRIRSIM